MYNLNQKSPETILKFAILKKCDHDSQNANFRPQDNKEKL